MLVARIALPVLALFFLWQRLGAEAFRPALDVVAPVPLLAGLILGGLAVLAQAARWRVLMAANGIPIGRPEAFAECYRSSALNAVLPGGVAGDVLRAWRQRARAPQGWRPAAGSVLADRMAGLCLLLAAAAVVLVVQSALLLAAACAAGSLIAWAVARPQLRRLDLRERAGVWGMVGSCVGVVARPHRGGGRHASMSTRTPLRLPPWASPSWPAWRFRSTSAVGDPARRLGRWRPF